MKNLNRKTELFLYHLLWTADMVITADYKNLGESFECWAYKNGFLRRVHELEQGDFLESDIEEKSLQRVYRLTASGKKQALGGRDPVEMWSRPWDGVWRMVIFDIPVRENKIRARLRRILLKHHFGCLQQSVWITPDPMETIRQQIGEELVDSKVLTCLEANPCMGESALDLTKSAWKFPQINARYQQHIELLKSFSKRRHSLDWTKRRDWLAEEKESWDACMALDPLLPREMIPAGYLGELAWETRLRTMSDVRMRSKEAKPSA